MISITLEVRIPATCSCRSLGVSSTGGSAAPTESAALRLRVLLAHVPLFPGERDFVDEQRRDVAHHVFGGSSSTKDCAAADRSRAGQTSSSRQATHRRRGPGSTGRDIDGRRDSTERSARCSETGSWWESSLGRCEITSILRSGGCRSLVRGRAESARHERIPGCADHVRVAAEEDVHPRGIQGWPLSNCTTRLRAASARGRCCRGNADPHPGA